MKEVCVCVCVFLYQGLNRNFIQLEDGLSERVYYGVEELMVFYGCCDRTGRWGFVRTYTGGGCGGLRAQVLLCLRCVCGVKRRNENHSMILLEWALLQNGGRLGK